MYRVTEHWTVNLVQYINKYCIGFPLKQCGWTTPTSGWQFVKWVNWSPVHLIHHNACFWTTPKEQWIRQAVQSTVTLRSNIDVNPKAEGIPLEFLTWSPFNCSFWERFQPTPSLSAQTLLFQVWCRTVYSLIARWCRYWKATGWGKGPNLYALSKCPHFLLEHLSLTVLLWSPPCPKVASWERCACADVPTNLGQCKDYRAFTLNAPSFLKTY